MAKKFGVGVANFKGYDPASGELILESKTMIDNTITTKANSKPIRAGQGDLLQYIYYYGGDLNVSLTEAQFNLGYIAATLGSQINIGDNIWTEESVTLGAGGTGSVQFPPLITPDITTDIYGWVTDINGVTTKVIFTGQDFTLSGALADDIVCVRYYRNDINTQSVTIPANIVPRIIRGVFDIQEGSPDSGDGIYGKIQVEIPRLQLDGSLTLGFKSTDVVNLPIKGQALAFTPSIGGCGNQAQYAIIREIPNNSNWYDNVAIIASAVDPITLSSTNTTYTLDMKAITNDSIVFKPPYSGLTFASDTPATCTISADGTITKVSSTNGDKSTITVSITDKPSIRTTVEVTIVAP